MDFTEVLDEAHTPYVNERDGWINFRCPRCHKEPYLGYNLKGRYTNCWSCGPLPLWEVVQLLTGQSPRECFRLIGELPRETSPLERLIHKGKLQLPEGLSGLQEPQRNYIKNRGFKPRDIISQWDVQGINQLGRHLAWRIFIPIHYRGQMCSWTSRRITNKEPRYFSATDEQSNLPVASLLYGLDYVRSHVVIVEGPLDVWAVGPGSVALLGASNWSPAQIAQLAQIPFRAVCLDNDPAGRERAVQLSRELSVHPGTTQVILLESGSDPADAHPDEIALVRREFLS